ncbi:MAG TPA: hypothetical protein VKB49_14065 [Candidatus Sulfotelmatobacter sp.]|nr:hypothetical protein [Candidatus Sulfotelmatobacter sp.]
MKRTRFALWLPLCAVLVTAALWHRARSEFSPSSLDVPIPLQVAGMLNGPVAVLASPCYAFSHGEVTAWRLAVLLLAVAFQWAYIGRLIDRRHEASRRPGSRGYTVGAFGVLFALGPPMAGFTTNVGLIYKAVALAWSLLMVYHFTGFFRNAPAAA